MGRKSGFRSFLKNGASERKMSLKKPCLKLNFGSDKVVFIKSGVLFLRISNDDSVVHVQCESG